MRKLASTILRVLGWKVSCTMPDYAKCIICVAPHTSNWDFVLGELAYLSLGRRAGFLMKDTWFVWPLGYFFRAIGGIPVPRRHKGVRSVTETVVEKFEQSEHLTIAITPEGTRKRTDQWRTGFLRIARQADVPVVLGAFDFATRHIYLDRVFEPTDDVEADMKAIKDYYRPFTGKYPDKFSAE